MAGAVVAGGAGADGRLDVRLLGPLEVDVGGAAVELGGPQPRAVVAHLALEHGRVVAVERLVARLWGDNPPASPLSSLHTTVSRLRRLLEPGRPAGSPSNVIVSEAPGYVLRIGRGDVDLLRFRDVALEGRRAAAAAHHEQALHSFDGALRQWRGPALAGLGPDEVIAPIAHAIEEERLAVVEDRFDAVLALGLHAEAVADLSVAVTEHPLRERLWSTFAIALYRSQRQADALRAIEQARRTLIDELGLDPGPELRELERRILEQDPALLAVPLAAVPQPAAPAPTRSSDARFVGRVEEWSRLITALDRADHGVPPLVLLEGEAGIGKSALAERLLEHASDRGWRVAVGRCADGDLAPALWPIVELAREIAGDAHVVEPAPGESERSRSPVEIADGVLAALDASAGDRWCLFVDDIHWADRPTLDVLALMAERLRDRRVLVMGAFRPVATVPDSALHAAIGTLTRVHGSERIVVAPLHADDVAEILRRTAGTAPTPEAVQIVYARAGGNPFFVGELARLFGEGGVTVGRAVPDAVRDVVRARLAPLPPITKAVLQLAAVAGERLDLPVVLAANGLDDDSGLDALDPAIVSRMLVTGHDHELRFAHAIVRDAVLVDIGTLQLSRLHRAVADALERVRGTGPDVIETIARHRLAGMPVSDPVRTAEQLVEASEVARWRGAFDTSDELAEHALDLVLQTSRTAEVDTIEIRALEGIVANAGRRRNAPADPSVAGRIEDIARRADSDAARALALYVRWWPMDVQPVPGFTGFARAAEALADISTNRFARLLGYHVAGTHAYQQGRLDDADRLLATAIESAGWHDPLQSPGYVPNVYLPAMAGIVAQLRGDTASAEVHAVQRLPAWFRARGRVDPTIDIDLGFTIALIAAIRRDPAVARQALNGVDYASAPPWAAFLGRGCGVLEGWSATMLGDPSGRDRMVSALDELDSSVPTRMLRPVFRTFLGDAMLHLDDPGALEVLERARAETYERGELWWLAETLRLSAHAERRYGDPTKSAELLDEAHDLARRQGAYLLVERVAADQ